MYLDPEGILNFFAKNVDTSFAGPIPNSLLARQDLEAEIVKLTNRNTPMRDVIGRTRGEGLAHCQTATLLWKLVGINLTRFL